MANYEKILSITAVPTVGTGVAYTSGDRCGSIMTLSNVGVFPGDSVILENFNVISRVNITTPNFTAYFFKELPTIASADNSPINIAVAEMAAKCVGMITGNNAQNSSLATGIMTRAALSTPLQCSLTTKDIYAVLVVNATPTFTGASDLTVLFQFRQFIPFQYSS